MRPVTLESADIERRLRRIQRRLNALSLQHAIYLGGSLVPLAAAALVVLAMRAPIAVFTVGCWSSIAGLATAAAFAATTVRRRWLSLREVARIVDREAGLDDRLATLLAEEESPLRSRLGPILARQVTATTARWEHTTIAPRLVPKSLAVLCASLLLVAAAIVMQRPASPAAAASSPSRRSTDKTHREAPARLAATTGDASSARPEAGTRDDRMAHAPDTGSARDAASAGKEPRSDEPGGSAEGSRRDASAAERLRSQIRSAMGAREPEAGPQFASARSGAPSAASRSANEGVGPTNANAANKTGEAKSGEDARAGTRSAPTNNDGSRNPAPRPGTGTGSDTRGGPGVSGGAGRSGTAGLLGGQSMSATGSAQPKTFPLQLNRSATAFSTDAGTKPSEPDAGRAARAAGGSADASDGPASDLRPDAPQYRADIAPEHRQVVRRIFGARE